MWMLWIALGSAQETPPEPAPEPVPEAGEPPSKGGITFAPRISGGLGFGALAPASSLLRVGLVAHGSAEITELIEPIPWLGAGVDLAVGQYLKACDLCDAYPVGRFGAGVVFRQRRGLLQVGARYSIGTVVSPQPFNKLRPYVRTTAILPIDAVDLRLNVWVEGIPTEIGAALELGWFLDRSGKWRVSR